VSEGRARHFERPSALARALSLRDLRWDRLDWHVVLLFALLLALGMAFVQAMALADEEHGRADVEFTRHLQKVMIALPAFVTGLALRARWLRRHSLHVWSASIALLVLVLVIGSARNGARRWIDLGPFDLQPSELAKVGVIVGLAGALDGARLARLSEWRRPLALALVPMGLVAVQPDLGTSLTIVPLTLALFYAAGASGRVIAAFLVGALGLGACLWQLELGIRDYQLQRLDAWTRGWSAPELIAERNTSAFHSYHARVAIGNGGVLGRGVGEGVANQTGWLPERDCDSIFAVVAEEAGFAGTTLILGVYALFVLSLFASASRLRQRFSRLVVAGVAVYFASHLLIHTGVNLGLLPLTGLTLPLFSTGGSSLLASFLALGIALGHAAQREPTLDSETFRS
jgi:rod shape determining protein RodA